MISQFCAYSVYLNYDWYLDN